MTYVPIPMTKTTWIALAIFIVLAIVGQYRAAVFLVIGWSLGGDGKVFLHARDEFSAWRKGRKAESTIKRM